jgi:hypothetical protein
MNIFTQTLISSFLITLSAFGAQKAEFLPQKTALDIVYGRARAYLNKCHSAYVEELHDIAYHGRGQAIHKKFWETYYVYEAIEESAAAYDIFIKEIHAYLKSAYNLTDAETTYIRIKLWHAYQLTADEYRLPKDFKHYEQVQDIAQKKNRLIDLYRKLDTDPQYAQSIKKVIAEVAEKATQEFIKQYIFQYKAQLLQTLKHVDKTTFATVLQQSIDKAAGAIDIYLTTRTDLNDNETKYIRLYLPRKFKNYQVIRNSPRKLSFFDGEKSEDIRIEDDKSEEKKSTGQS